MTVPGFIERRQADRRHSCDYCPASHPHSRRVMMLGPMIALTTLALSWSAGFIYGQVRLAERPRFSSLSQAIELLPQYGPPIPAHVGTVER
jgi:hypothetical protein